MIELEIDGELRQVYTIEELADSFHLSTRSMRKWVENGKLKKLGWAFRKWNYASHGDQYGFWIVDPALAKPAVQGKVWQADEPKTALKTAEINPASLEKISEMFASKVLGAVDTGNEPLASEVRELTAVMREFIELWKGTRVNIEPEPEPEPESWWRRTFRRR